MSKTVTLRINEGHYSMFRKMAQEENRTLSNFIETATLQYIEEHEVVDEFEMEEIRNNVELNKGLKRGLRDAKLRRGRFIG